MRLLKMSVLSLLLLVVNLHLAPQPALAADIEVADCTRAGLAAAINAAGDGGNVTFDCNPEVAISFPPGEWISITFDVTIDGSVGADRMILDGGSASSFFVVTSGATLTIQNLILQHGYDASEGGGAIRVAEGGALDVSSCGFLFNSTGVAGGAIDNEGTVGVSQCSFLGNTADSGGAILNAGQLTIDTSSFSQNKAVEGAAQGGAVVSIGSSMTISLSTFTDNQASYGGALSISVIFGADPIPTTTITQSAFLNNKATGHGGAINMNEGVLNVTASTFSGNTANEQARGGSAAYFHLLAQSNTIAYSTIIQPAGTTPAIGMEGPLTVEGVIFEGEGSHCLFDDSPGNFAVLTDSYTLSNDDSCGLEGTGSHESVTNMELGDLTTTVVNGVARIYYPLLEGSDAINAGPASCATPDQLDTARPFGPNCDIGAYEFVENSAPAISNIITSPANPVEGQNTALSVIASDVDVDTLSYSFDCTNDGVWEVEDQDSTSYTCIYPNNGSYTVAVEVSDGTASDSDTKVISVANAKPEITSFRASTLTPQINETVTLSVVADDVEADMPLTITYSCDDGTTYGAINQCTFATGGTHTVWVKVDDEEGGVATDSLDLKVNSAPSDIEITVSPAIPLEGQDATVSVGATDADSDSLNYWIDCGEDVTDDWELTDSTSSSTTCNYPDNGNYTITAQISDGSVSVKASQNISVANVAPSVSDLTATPSMAQVAELVTLSVDADDVDADQLMITYECGGGTPVGTNQCSYSTPGNYTAKVTVDDGDGGVVTRKAEIFVNAPPAIAGINVSPGTVEGEPVSFEVLATDADGDTLTYSFDCTNDGTWEVEDQDNNTYMCIYPDNGDFTINVRASDGGASDFWGQTITVANLDPVFSSFVASPNPALTGRLVILSATATDVAADTVTYSYSCGAGVQVSDDQCRFDVGGTYQVSMLASDEDGGSVGRKLMVRVYDATTLCANRWNGALRMVDGSGDCDRSEVQIELPMPSYAELELCVNVWNGAARASDDCSRSEYQLLAIGDDTIAVCVNRWNGVLRKSQECSRSEYADSL